MNCHVVLKHVVLLLNPSSPSANLVAQAAFGTPDFRQGSAHWSPQQLTPLALTLFTGSCLSSTDITDIHVCGGVIRCRVLRSVPAIPSDATAAKMTAETVVECFSSLPCGLQENIAVASQESNAALFSSVVRCAERHLVACWTGLPQVCRRAVVGNIFIPCFSEILRQVDTARGTHQSAKRSKSLNVFPHGTLICGEVGSGKSRLALSIAQSVEAALTNPTKHLFPSEEMEVQTISSLVRVKSIGINLLQMALQVQSSSPCSTSFAASLRSALLPTTLTSSIPQSVSTIQPVVLWIVLLEGIDVLTESEERSGQDDFSFKHTPIALRLVQAELLRHYRLWQTQLRGPNVLLISTSRTKDKHNVFQDTIFRPVHITLPRPAGLQRAAVISALFSDTDSHSNSVEQLAVLTRGYTTQEVVSFALEWKNLTEADRVEKGKALLREKVNEGIQASFKQLVGLEETTDLIYRTLLWPLFHAGELAALGITVPRGLLVVGQQSGCGKTSLLAAIRGEVNRLNKEYRQKRLSNDCRTVPLTALDDGQVSVLLYDANALLQKEVGASEKNVANMFERARTLAPCILLLDDLETIAPPRGTTTAEANVTADRVLSTLLTEMDGLRSQAAAGPDAKGIAPPVLVVATARSLASLDPALCRAGRLDLHVSLSPPTALSFRAYFLEKLHLLLRQNFEADDKEGAQLLQKSVEELSEFLEKQSATFADARGILATISAKMINSDRDEFTVNEVVELLMTFVAP